MRGCGEWEAPSQSHTAGQTSRGRCLGKDAAQAAAQNPWAAAPSASRPRSFPERQTAGLREKPRFASFNQRGMGFRWLGGAGVDPAPGLRRGCRGRAAGSAGAIWGFPICQREAVCCLGLWPGHFPLNPIPEVVSMWGMGRVEVSLPGQSCGLRDRI